MRKDYDLIGMAVLAEITAVGGGVIRDLIIGATPPVAFADDFFLLVPLGAVLLTYFAHAQLNRINAAVLVFDAAGLGVFCVAGAAKALAYGMGPVEAVALAVLTGIGGGIIRDVLANERPVVLRADSTLYATPAALGGLIVVVAQSLHLYGSVTAGLAAVFVFALRLGALHYGWRAPKPRQKDVPPVVPTDERVPVRSSAARRDT